MDIQTFVKIVNSIREGAAYRYDAVNPTYESIEWIETRPELPKPTLEEFNAAVTLYESKQYQRDRASEYPPITDYLDGVVKGDQAQIDAYIAACQAVKTKYPKV